MQNNNLLDLVADMLKDQLEGDIFLVDMKVKPTNNIKIYLDADSGLGIEKCIKINRALYKKMEESGLFPGGDFSLEVSSPGVDEPLKMHRQYKKNIGRKVEVIYLDSLKKEGKLVAVDDAQITIEYTEGKGKKAELLQTVIPIADIKQIKVLISF
jgi:ribosome maturation factor RimP